MRRIGLPLWVSLTAAGFVVAPLLVFLQAPLEREMGFVQKIFYFHVPCAWVMFLGAFVCAGGSVAFLARGSKAGDRVALAAGELTVLFGVLVLVTGPLWARKAWGRWWVWDVRLTSSLMMWMVFVAYLLARQYGGTAARKLAAGLAIFGAIEVPLIYKAVDLWRTIHPKTEVVRTLDPAMRPAFYVSGIVFVLLAGLLFRARVALESARDDVDQLYLAAEK
jgi:heme exporter protein C